MRGRCLVIIMVCAKVQSKYFAICFGKENGALLKINCAPPEVSISPPRIPSKTTRAKTFDIFEIDLLSLYLTNSAG